MKPSPSFKKMLRPASTFGLLLVLSVFCRPVSSRADEATTVLSHGPVAFYQLNDTANPAGSPAAVDSAGTNNGVYLPSAQNAYNGITGPRSAGFTSDNAALKTTSNAANAYIGLPALPLTGNTITILAWVNPNASSGQNKGAGIAFNTRDTSGGSGGNASNACGFGFAQSGTVVNGMYPLYGMWRNTGWNWYTSGLYVPTNQWSMVAAVFSPTNISLYLINANGSASASLAQNNAPASWNLPGTPYANYLGTDPYSIQARNFEGRIDDVAFFNYCLSSNQLASIYSAGFSNVNVAPFIAAQPSPVSNYETLNASFTVAAFGDTPLAYQWQRGGSNLTDQGNLSGTTNSTMVITNLALTNAADYRVIVSNSSGTVTSSVATLTVIPDRPTIPDSGQPVPVTVYTGSTATFSVAPLGLGQSFYRWRRGGANLSDVGNISGSTNSTLTITGAALTNSGNFDVIITNTYGSITSSVASLTVLTPTGLASQAVSLGALAFWELNENGNPALGGVAANDYIGSYKGAYQTNAQDGVAGPRPPAFPGFPSTNAALRTFWNSPNSYVGLPAINYTGNSATMVAWVNPAAFHAESGILFSTRDGSGSLTAGTASNSCGLGFSGAIPYAPLMALWGNNGWNWSSGLYVPTNQWSMVAGVVTPTSITVYMINASGVQSASTNYSNPVCTWMMGGTNYLGMDPYDGAAGSFDGSIDDVAFFGSSLSAAQLLQLYAAGTSTNFIQVSSQPVSAVVDPNQTAQFTVTATSTAALHYQWYAAFAGGNYVALTNGGNVSGATAATLNISNASARDCLNYYVQVINADGAVVNSASVSLSLTSWEQPGQGGVVNAVVASPNGAWIASGSDDGTVKLWNSTNGSLARTLAAGGLVRVTALAFSANSATLAAGYVDGSIRLWNPATGAQGRTINLLWSSNTKTNNLGKISGLAFSPDGQYLATAGGDLYTRIWKLADLTMNQALVKNAGPVGSIAWSPDGTKVFTGSEDKKVNVFNTSAWSTPTSYTLGSNVTSVALSPNGATLAAGSLDGKVTIWQVSNMSTSNSYTGTGAGVTSLAFGTDGQTLFSGDETGFITRWASSSGWVSATQNSWSAHTNGVGGVRSLAVTSDNSKLASGGSDYQVKLWRATDGSALSNLTSHAGLITRSAFSPNGSLVASASADGSVGLWAAASGAPLSFLTGHTNQVSALAFSPDSSFLVSGGGCLDNTLRIYNLTNLASPRTIVAATNGVTAVAVSPDSSLVAAGGDRSEQRIRVWHMGDGSWVRDLAGHASGTGALAFSPNGLFLASGGLLNDGTIKLWNLNNGNLVRTFAVPPIADQYPTFAVVSNYSATGPFVTNTVVHTCTILSLAFNPTSTLLASAGERDGVVNIWQTGTGSLLASLTDLPRGARAVAFSPDGTLLAAAGSDAIQMWRTSDWQPVWNYTTETVGISSLSFSPNGTFLVFGRDDGTVSRIWNPLANPVNVALGLAQGGHISIDNPYSPFLSVWASSNPANPSGWSLLTNVVASTNVVRITDPSPSLPSSRFYRVTTPQ